MKNPDLELAKKHLSDPFWRINSLYNIVDKRGQKIRFRLNWAQEKLYREMWYCNVILKARQLGISTFVCLLFLDRILFNSNMSAGIICHTREDAEHLFKRIKFAYDNMPSEIKSLRPAHIDSARELKFSNGSSVRVGTSMRGQTLQYLHISEFGKICAKFPDKAQEIITGSLNTLAPGQYVFIESTAEGREGAFYELSKHAKALLDQKKDLTKLDFKFHFYPWWKEPSYRIGSPVVISEEMHQYFSDLVCQGIELDPEQKFWYAARHATQGESMKREFPSTPEESWEQSTEGTYYARLISQARSEARIGFVPYDESLPVYTAWDLGYNDSTSIWFFQVYGKEVRLIEYIEGSGESLSHWLGVVKSKEYTYEKHLAPHDILVHEYSSGMTRQSSARKMGVNLMPVQKVDIIPGIDQVRNILPRCWFDEKKCSQGIRSLENYKKEWNDRAGCWSSRPLHNWASHGCFTGETLILTRFGRLPIMLIEKDMEILTLKGWKKCNKAIVTKKNAQLVEVKLSDGMNVRCTPDHLFLTEKGWISAENLEKDIKIQSSLIRSQRISEDVYTGFCLRRDILKKVDHIYTGMFGKTLSGRSLKNVTYIIETIISKITSYQIWNVCPIQSISNSKDQTQNPYLIKLEKRRKNGIDPKKEENGIEGKRSDRRVGQNGRGKKKSVQYVMNCTRLLLGKVVMLKNIVLQSVNPLHVLDVIKLNETEDVYCINVPDVHHFSLANGAVVHNSDAFRTLATGLHFITNQKSRSETERDRLEALRDKSGLLPGHYLYSQDVQELQKNPFYNQSRTNKFG